MKVINFYFRIVENAGLKHKKECSAILLDEWGTSGRIRPRLGHLLTLLKKAELYRAADYVAIELLKSKLLIIFCRLFSLRI